MSRSGAHVLQRQVALQRGEVLDLENRGMQRSFMLNSFLASGEKSNPLGQMSIQTICSSRIGGEEKQFCSDLQGDAGIRKSEPRRDVLARALPREVGEYARR